MLHTEVLNFASTSDQRSHKENSHRRYICTLPTPNNAEAKESRRKRVEAPASRRDDANMFNLLADAVPSSTCICRRFAVSSPEDAGAMSSVST